jgi:hypothetical protein
MRIREAQKHTDPIDPDSDPELRKKTIRNSINQGFFYNFCLMMEGSRAGAGVGSVLVTTGPGSGPGKPKNIRIQRIRIHNSGFKLCCLYRPWIGQFGCIQLGCSIQCVRIGSARFWASRIRISWSKNLDFYRFVIYDYSVEEWCKWTFKKY